MLLIDNREPEHIQALLAENERLRARVEQLTKVLSDILRVRDCQGVWGLASGQEIKEARRILGMRWEILDVVQDVITERPWRDHVTHRQS